MQYGVLGKNNDMHAQGTSMEDSMKFLVRFNMSRDDYDRSLYLESAKRVVFRNCMNSLGLDDKMLPNFNRDFYYNKKPMQEALQECYNTRMTLHFGEKNADTHDMLIDFENLKRQY